ncbi:MAG: thiamine pyrophosphate-dependent enzyme [bacterium]|nr:thiamine pyrophosphate-dependent enzyme [bacterium]
MASATWFDEVHAALAYRPSRWADIHAAPDEPLHAVEVCRAVQAFLSQDDKAIYISDGGEFGQWAQACLSSRRRLINGPSGTIGGAIPFALAAREAFPDARIVAMLGDGTFGFQPAEFDTATRQQLPFIAVVGNDATWNAEYQLQLRTYGPDRLIGCELLPTRYHDVAQAFGGYGVHVSSAPELVQALEAAYASGQPACLNVSLAKNAAPIIRRDT